MSSCAHMISAINKHTRRRSLHSCCIDALKRNLICWLSVNFQGLFFCVLFFVVFVVFVGCCCFLVFFVDCLLFLLLFLGWLVGVCFFVCLVIAFNRAKTASSLVSGFSNPVLFSVVSGCFVDRVSPSLPLRPKLALTRGLEGSELAFRRLKSACKVRAKSFGP